MICCIKRLNESKFFEKFLAVSQFDYEQLEYQWPIQYDRKFLLEAHNSAPKAAENQTYLAKILGTIWGSNQAL